jgi:hypothetical protein
MVDTVSLLWFSGATGYDATIYVVEDGDYLHLDKDSANCGSVSGMTSNGIGMDTNCSD